MIALRSLFSLQAATALQAVLAAAAAVAAWSSPPLAGVLAGAAVACAGATLLGLTVLRRWTRRVTATAQRVAAGDFEPRLVHLPPPGELRAMLDAINAAIDLADAFQRETGAAMQHVSEDRYYRPIIETGLVGAYQRQAQLVNQAIGAIQRKVGAFADLADRFEATLRDVNQSTGDAAGRLGAGAASLSEVTSSAAASTAAVAAAASQSSGNVQAVAAAATELSQSIDEIARQVQRAATLAQGSVGASEGASAAMARLARAGQAIRAIIASINALAGQTNLLALNATIEAARNGEAGKGFAVVANEVKALAKQTADATQLIRTQVEDMSDATTSAVAAIDSVLRSIREVDDVSSAIAAAVQQQSAATQEISRNVQQASDGTAEVSAQLTRLHEMTETTRGSAELTKSSAEALAQQSATLGREIGAFFCTVRRSA